MTRIPNEKLHDLRQHIYMWLISNGYATDREDAKNVAKFNGILMNKIKVRKVDYVELKEKAKKFDLLREILK